MIARRTVSRCRESSMHLLDTSPRSATANGIVGIIWFTVVGINVCTAALSIYAFFPRCCPLVPVLVSSSLIVLVVIRSLVVFDLTSRYVFTIFCQEVVRSYDATH